MAFRTIGTPTTVTTGTGTPLSDHPLPPTPTGTGGILVQYNIAGATNMTSITSPASPWVELYVGTSGTGDKMVVLWLPAGNTPTGSEVISAGAGETNRSYGYAWRVSGADAWTPQVGSGSTGSGNTPDPPTSGTLSWGSGHNTFMACAAWKNSSASLLTAYPTNYTQGQVTDGGATGAAAGVGAGSAQMQSVASSDDPGTFTFGGTSKNWVAQTIGIKFEASGDVTPPAVPTGLTATAVYTA